MKNTKGLILIGVVIVFGLIFYGSYVSTHSFLKGLYIVATLSGIGGIIQTWMERKIAPKTDIMLKLLFFIMGFTAAIIALMRI